MVIIFTGDYIETINIKNLLTDFNIESYILNEYMGSIRPYIITSGGFNPVSLQVDEDDFDDAKKILEEYNKGSYSLD